MNAKKILGGCSVGIMVIFLAVGGVSAKGEKISYLVTKDPVYYGIEKVIPEFEKQTGIKVILEGVTWDENREKALLDFISGAGNYDVINVDDSWTAEFAKYLTPLDSLIQKSADEIDILDIVSPVWSLYEYEDKIVGLPILCYTHMIIYRKDLYDKFGLSPATDLEQYRENAKKLTVDLDGDGNIDVYGTAFNGKRGAAITDHWSSFLVNFGGRFLRRYPERPWDLRPIVNSPEAIETLKYYVSLLEFAPPGTVTYDWFDTGGALWSGRVAQINHLNVYYTMASSPERSKVVGKIDTFPLPSKKGTPKRGWINGWASGINKDSKNKESAWTFIKWLASTEVQKEMVRVSEFSEPARYSVITDPEMVKKLPFLPSHLVALETGYPQSRLHIPVFPVIQEKILGTRLNQALIGELSPEEALDKANQEIYDLLKERGYLE